MISHLLRWLGASVCFFVFVAGSAHGQVDSSGLAALLRSGSHEKVQTKLRSKFDQGVCSTVELKFFATALLAHLYGRPIGARIADKLFDRRLELSGIAIDSILAKSPNDPDGLFLRGIRYKITAHNSAAGECFQKVLGIDSTYEWVCFSDALDELGSVLMKTETYDNAHEIYSARLRLLPERASSHLRLISIEAARGHAESATRSLNDAISAGDSAVIEQLWQDAAVISETNEARSWPSCITLRERRQFVAAFWKARDPNPVDLANERLAEHYRRTVEVRIRYAHHLPPYYDDRGRVYVRLGKPDQSYFGVSSATSAADDDRYYPVESWLYQRAGELHFDFVNRDGTYFLAPLDDAARSPSLGNLYELYASRSLFHSYYAQRALRIKAMIDAGSGRASEVYQTSVSEFYSHESKSKQQNFEYDYGSIPVFVRPAVFRTARGSRLDVGYGIQASELKFFRLDSDSSTSSFIKVQCAVFDSNFFPVAESLRELQIVSQSEVDAASLVLDEVRFDVPPGRYTVALDVRNNNGAKLRFEKQTVDVRTFQTTGLQLSDLQPALSVSNADGIDRFVKPHSRIRVLPDPTASMSVQRPLAVYYEVYGLTLDDQGKSHYEVTYVVQSTAKKSLLRRLASLFGAGGHSVEQTTVAEGSGQTERDFIMLNIGELTPHPIDFSIRVRDLLSGSVASSSASIVLHP